MSEATGEFLFSDNLEKVRQGLQVNLRGIVSDLETAGSSLNGKDFGVGYLDAFARNLAVEGTKIVQQVEQLQSEITSKLQSGKGAISLPTGGFAAGLQGDGVFGGEGQKKIKDFLDAQLQALPDSIKANPQAQQVISRALTEFYDQIARNVREQNTKVRGAAVEAGVNPNAATGLGSGLGEIERFFGSFIAEFRGGVSDFARNIQQFQAEGREVAERIRAASASGQKLTPGDEQAVRAGAAGTGPLANAVTPTNSPDTFAVQVDQEAFVGVTGNIVKGFSESGPIVLEILNQGATNFANKVREATEGAGAKAADQAKAQAEAEAQANAARRSAASAEVGAGLGVTAGRATFSSQGVTETGTGKLVTDFTQLRNAAQALSSQVEKLDAALTHAGKTPIDGLVQGLFGAGGRKRTGGAQPVDADSPLFGLFETAGVVAKYEVLGRGIASLGQAATGAVKDFASLDQSTRELNEVFSTNISASSGVIDNLQNIAASAGIASGELIKAATTAGAAFGGDSGAGRLQAAQDAAPFIAQSSAITGQDASSSTGDLVAIGNAYQITADQLGRVTNAVANARNQFGGNAGEIQKGLGSLAEVGRQAGFSLEELAAVVGKVQATTTDGGTQIASSLTRIFNTLGNKGTRTNISSILGIELTGDVKTNIEQLAGAFSDGKLDASQRRFLENTVGGAKGLRDLLPLLADQPGLQAAYKKALEDTDQGQKAADASINSLAGQLRQFGQDLKNLGVDIAKSGVLDPLIAIFELVKPGIEILDRLVQTFDKLPGPIKGFAATLFEASIAFNAFKVLAEKGVLTSVTGLGANVGQVFTGRRNEEGALIQRGLLGNPFEKVSPAVSANAELKAASTEFSATLKASAAEVAAAQREAATLTAQFGAESAVAAAAQARLAEVSDAAGVEIQAAAARVAEAQAAQATATDAAAAGLTASEAARAAADDAATTATAARTAADAAAATASRAKFVVDSEGVAASAEEIAADAEATAAAAELAATLAATNAEYVAADTSLGSFIEAIVAASVALQGLAGRTLAKAAEDVEGNVVGKSGILRRVGFGGGRLGILGGDTLAEAGGGAIAGTIGAGLLIDKQLLDDRRKVDASFKTSGQAQDKSGAAVGDANALQNAASSLDEAQKKIADSSKGPIGSITGALTEVFGSAGNNRGLERQFDRSLAAEDRRAAGAISDATKSSSAGAGAFDLSAVNGVSDGLKALSRDGATAQQQLDFLNGALGQLGDASKGAGRRLLAGQSGVLAAKAGDAIAQGVGAEGENDSQQGGIFGSDTSDAGDKLRGIKLDKLGGDLTGDVKTALADSGLDKGTVTKEKFAAATVEIEASLKKRLAEQGVEFSKLPKDVQDRLLNAAKGGLAEQLNKIDAGGGTITKDNIDEVLAQAPQLAAKAGANAATAASLSGDSRGGGLAGAEATRKNLQDTRAKLAAVGATDAQLADLDLQIQKANLDVQNATVAHVAALSALATASVSQFDKAGQIQSQLAGLDAQIAAAKKDGSLDADKQAAFDTQRKGILQNKNNQIVADANSLARVGIDSRNVTGNAQRDLADAQAKLDEITKGGNGIAGVNSGQAYNDAVRAVNDAKVKYAQTQIAQANLLAASQVAVGDKVGELQAAAAAAAAVAAGDLAGSPQQAADQRAAAIAANTAALAADARATAQKAAKIDPRNVLADDKNTLAGLQQQLKDTAPGNADAIAALQRQIAQQQIKVRQDQLDLAHAQREASIDPRDTIGEANEAVRQAHDALANLLPGTAAYAAAQKAYKQAVIADAQAKIDLANTIRDASVFPGDALGAASAAVQNAKANLQNDRVGSIKYFQDLKTLRDAQVAYAKAIEDQQNVLEQLGTDQTNPVQQAINAVDAARRKLSDDRKLGAPTAVLQQDQLNLNNAQNNAERTAFQQQLQDAQTNLQLHRISGKAYLQYLETLRTNILATGLKTRQQVDELNQVDQAILAANQTLQGQFNLGDIKVPTVFEVRRAVAAAGDALTAANPFAGEGLASTPLAAASPFQNGTKAAITPVQQAIEAIQTAGAVSNLTALQTAIAKLGAPIGPIAQPPGAPVLAAGLTKAELTAFLTDAKAGRQVDLGQFRQIDIAAQSAKVASDAARLAQDQRGHASTKTIAQDKIALANDQRNLANVKNNVQINGADFGAVVAYLQSILGGASQRSSTTPKKVR